MKYLYKYPHAAYPYERPGDDNRRRGNHEPEYELLDTGIFDDGRYFDVFVEYAKAAPDDLLMRITVANRGPEAAPLHVLPTLWFRNTWSQEARRPKPELTALATAGAIVQAHHTDRCSGVAAPTTACTSTARCRCCSPRTRPTTPRLFGTANAAPLRQGRLPRLR